MTNAQTGALTPRKPLRLWPGGVGGVLLGVGFLLPIVMPDAALVAMMSGLAGALIVIVWWVFFSRARWSERIGAVVVAVAAMFAISRVIHPSIAGGAMGMLFPFVGAQSLTLAFVIWAVAGRNLPDGLRRASMVAAILVGCGVWTGLRTDGMLAGGSQLAWRWTPTSEERLLAQAADVPGGNVNLAPAAAATTAEWPGFRGPGRDSVIRGVRIETDWSKSPPIELWRRAIGPGWSSFAVLGDRIYTQEQRGDEELVACYSLATGKPVWMHRDATRFWESNGGAGPRGTPTLSRGRVYAFGATGILNALDAGTGAVVWSRNAASDTGAKIPGWGFSSSPLVQDDLVIVATAGQLAAYDLASGQPRWSGPAHGGSYSSPQLLTLDGVAQVVLLSTAGATSVDPADGQVLWEHEWPGGAIVQPAVTADGDIVINSIGMTGGAGTRRLAVAHGASGWTVTERWTSAGLKPYFNDFVVHKGHAYGFDGSILASIDLANGTRAWKGGRYGDGQLVLLPDQDLLLVLSEEGTLALVKATPDKFTEVARVPAIEGKTWNHPVLVGDVLLVRNGEEMAAFRLALAGR